MFEFFHFALLSDDEARSFRFRRRVIAVSFGEVAVEGNARRIVTAILQSMKAIDQNISNESTVAFDQVIQVTEDACREADVSNRLRQRDE